MGRIFILDEIIVKPGLTAVFRAAYDTRYVPAARRRGMRLESAWRSPGGQDFDELPTTLYYMWSVEGVPGWWRMRFSRTETGADERFEKHRWWQDSGQMTLSRKRSFLTSLDEEG